MGNLGSSTVPGLLLGVDLCGVFVYGVEVLQDVRGCYMGAIGGRGIILGLRGFLSCRGERWFGKVDRDFFLLQGESLRFPLSACTLIIGLVRFFLWEVVLMA